MISIEELNEVKEKRKTNLYNAEKEYLQRIFLNAISRFSKNFVFKGGTCLRICYGLERASEDLDFSSSLSLKEIRQSVSACLKDFDLLGISYEIYSEKEFKGNIRFEIRFKGPLFSGHAKSTNTLKIDFNRQKSKHTLVKIVQKLFSDIPLFSIVVLDEKEILAEKIRALINRKEARDLYDIWVLLNKDVEIDKKLINQKMKEENSKFDNLELPSKEEYLVGLKNLLNVLPDYDQVKREVLVFFQKIRK